MGRLHIANLGDGAGNRTEELLARINFDWPSKVQLLLLFLLSLVAYSHSLFLLLNIREIQHIRNDLGIRYTRTGVARLGYLLGNDCGWQSFPRLEAGWLIRSNGGMVPGVRPYFPLSPKC